MKSLLKISFLGLFLMSKSWGQTTLDAAGSFVRSAGYSASYAVGEIYSATQKNPARLLYSTGGVIQPDPVLISGVQNKTFASLNLFPNPVSDVLFIQGAEGLSLKYLIIQPDGNQVQSGVLTEGQIDCRGLTPGIYLLKLIDRHSAQSAYLLTKF